MEQAYKIMDGEPFAFIANAPPADLATTLWFAVAVASVLLLLAYCYVYSPGETDWEHEGEGRMRRRTRGKWEYREMTQEEYDDWFDRTGW